jgi:Xaa-Pro aminopeptidase
MAETWRHALAQSGLVAVDISAGLGEVLGVKDEDEIRNVKKAAFLAARALSHAVAKIEGKCCQGGWLAKGMARGL